MASPEPRPVQACLGGPPVLNSTWFVQRGLRLLPERRGVGRRQLRSRCRGPAAGWWSSLARTSTASCTARSAGATACGHSRTTSRYRAGVRMRIRQQALEELDRVNAAREVAPPFEEAATTSATEARRWRAGPTRRRHRHARATLTRGRGPPRPGPRSTAPGTNVRSALRAPFDRDGAPRSAPSLPRPPSRRLPSPAVMPAPPRPALRAPPMSRLALDRAAKLRRPRGRARARAPAPPRPRAPLETKAGARQARRPAPRSRSRRAGRPRGSGRTRAPPWRAGGPRCRGARDSPGRAR